jgi:glycosyltransferase involved in cell wall biosynthesis
LGIEFKNREQRKKEKRDKYYSTFKEDYSLFDCEIATLPLTEYDILENPLVKVADIIHLHWVAGMLDYSSFFKNNKKPVVWTLHDMNPFQGLFHYKEDELRNWNYGKFDTEIQIIKRKSIKSRKSKLAIVSPSKWLLKEALNSKVFKNSTSCCIPNPINNEVFSDRKKNLIKADKVVFLFIAHSVIIRRKGFDLLVEALRKVNISSFTVLVLGEVPEFGVGDLDIRFLGAVNENEKLKEYFSMADAFIIPSREDNLPNVMLESFACGTPVIGFPVGGIKEHVIDFKTGLLTEEISSDSLARTIEKFYVHRERFDRQIIQDYAQEHFAEKLIANKYLDLYKQLLKN